MEQSRPYYSYHSALRCFQELQQNISSLLSKAPFLQKLLEVIDSRITEYGTSMVNGAFRFPSYQFELENMIDHVRNQFPPLQPPTPEEVAAAHAPPRILSFPFICRMTCKETEMHLQDIFEPDAPPLLYVTRLNHFFLAVSDWLYHQHKTSLF